MIKNAMRIGKLVALSSLLSIALSAPMAAIKAGAATLADAAGSGPYASWATSAANETVAQASAQSPADRRA